MIALRQLADAVAHQVCQGRSLEWILEDARHAEWPIDGAALEDRVTCVYKSLTSEDASALHGAESDVLALIGDCPHNPACIRPAVESAIGAVGLRVRFIYDVRRLNARNLSAVRLLIVLRDGMLWPEPGGEPVWWLTEEQETAVAGFVQAGGGYLALHNATALKCIDDTACLYRDLLGSSYSGHGPADEKFTVRVVNRDHPVTGGVRDYRAVDERHWPVLHADDITVLTRSISGAESSVNGYVRRYGAGRVCYLANGHTQRMLSCEPMQRLIANALLWCVGQEGAYSKNV